MGQPTETHSPLGEDREVRSQERENMSFDGWTGVGEILRRGSSNGRKRSHKTPEERAPGVASSLQGIGEQNAEWKWSCRDLSSVSGRRPLFKLGGGKEDGAKTHTSGLPLRVIIWMLCAT